MAGDAILPRVGCGAAIIEAGRLLLVRRRRDPEAGCWGLPGGKVEPFEIVADAIAREIQEELGIAIQSAALLCLVEQIDRAGVVHWVSPVFRIDGFVGTPRIMEPHALSDLGWFELEALPAPLTIATKVALAALGHSRTG